MRVAVTGATGFVGRELVRQLHAAGHEIVGLLLPSETAATVLAVHHAAPSAHSLSSWVSGKGPPPPSTWQASQFSAMIARITPW